MKPGWTEVGLGEVASVVRDAVSPADIPQGTPYVGLENVERGGRLIKVAVANGEVASAKFAFSPSHVLYGKLRPTLAKVARPNFAGVCSTDILPVDPGPRLDRDYLAHFLLSPTTVRLATQRASGANLPRLSQAELMRFRLPLPPLAEQRRIARVLDAAESIRAQRRRSLLLLRHIRYAMLPKFVSTADGGPALVELGSVADIQGGLQVTRKREAHASSVPYLRVANVRRGALDLSEIKSMGVSPGELERCRLESGDLLVVEGHGNPGEIGRVARWDGSVPDCVHQNHLIRVRVRRDRLLPVYAEVVMNSPVGRRDLLRRAKTTSGLNTITVTDVRRAQLPLPPIEQQSQFEAIAARNDAAITTAATHERCLDELFASLQHRAFTGAL